MSRVVHTLLFHFHSNFMKIYYLCFSYIMKLRLREENCPVMTQLVICRTSMWLYIWLYICLSSSDSEDCAIIPLSNVAKLDIWGLKAACKVVTWKLMMLAVCLPDALSPSHILLPKGLPTRASPVILLELSELLGNYSRHLW